MKLISVAINGIVSPSLLPFLLLVLVSFSTSMSVASAHDAVAPPGATATTPAPATAAAPTLAAQLARIDDLHRRRDDKAAWNEEQQLVQATLARAPSDYGALWRAARFYFWLSDDPGLSKDDRAREGKEGSETNPIPP